MKTEYLFRLFFVTVLALWPACTVKHATTKSQRPARLDVKLPPLPANRSGPPCEAFSEAGALLRERHYANALDAFEKTAADYPETPWALAAKRTAWRMLWKTWGGPHDAVRDINIASMTAGGGYLYAGSWSGGVARYSLSRNRWEPFYSCVSNESSNAIRDIRIHGNNVWIATMGSGVLVMSHGKRKILHLDQSKGIPDRVKCISIHEPYAWIGTMKNGLVRYNIKNRTVRRYTTADGLPGNHVLDVTADGRSVWIGTLKHGTAWLDMASGKWHRPDVPDLRKDNVKCIAMDAAFVWVGTWGKGLRKYNRYTGRWTTYGKKILGPDGVYILSVTMEDDRIWIGTMGAGAILYDPVTEQWKTFTQFEGLPSRNIADMYVTRHYIWFASWGAGVIRYANWLKPIGAP